MTHIPALIWKNVMRRHGLSCGMPKGRPRMADEQQRRLSLPAVTRALINARGVMSTAASALGVSRSALSAYVSKTAEAAKAYQEARQGLCDMAENRLVEAVEAGDWRATLFVLSTL